MVVLCRRLIKAVVTFVPRRSAFCAGKLTCAQSGKIHSGNLGYEWKSFRTSQAGYTTATNTSPLVSIEWLRERLAKANERLSVLDTTWYPMKDSYPMFVEKHIPGAQFLDLNKHVQATPHIPRNVPQQDLFEDYMQSLGVKSDDHIVVYDRYDASDVSSVKLTAGRTWWLLRAFGHDRVSVLDGGLKKWEDDGCDTETGDAVVPVKGNWRSQLSTKLVCDYDRMLDMIQRKDHQIVDSRFTNNFTGHEEEPSAVTKVALQDRQQPAISSDQIHRGHMPGSYNIPYTSLISTTNNCYKDGDELRKLFEEQGIDVTKPMVATCFIGHTACSIALAAHVLGRTDVPVYAGSWTEFGQRAPAELCEISPK